MANDLTKKKRPGVCLMGLRIGMIAVGLGLWFWTQGLLGVRDDHFDPQTAQDLLQGDAVLQLLEGGNQYLHENPRVADVLLIISSLLINALAIYLFLVAILGSTIRPFLGLLILFALRQICQAVSALPAPPEMIWHQPVLGGWEPPGLLVTYAVGNDFFFSGHTAIAVYGAIELSRLRQGVWRILGIALGIASGIFQVGVVLLLRAHWTVDVYAGLVTALLVAFLVQHLAPHFDHLLERISARCSGDRTSG